MGKSWLIPKRQILDPSKLKEFADDAFKFGVNGRKFFKRVEDTVGKGEINRCGRVLLFQPCFQKTCTTDTYKPGKPGLVPERVTDQQIFFGEERLIPNNYVPFLKDPDRQTNRQTDRDRQTDRPRERERGGGTDRQRETFFKPSWEKDVFFPFFL